MGEQAARIAQLEQENAELRSRLDLALQVSTGCVAALQLAQRSLADDQGPVEGQH